MRGGIKRVLGIQPVPEKMKLEMNIKTEIEVLNGQSSGLFSNEPLKETCDDHRGFPFSFC